MKIKLKGSTCVLLVMIVKLVRKCALWIKANWMLSLKIYVQPFALLGKRYVCTLLQQAISVSFTGLQQLS